MSREHEETHRGWKRQRNPNAWRKKHVKKPGLRKNAPCEAVSSQSKCCKKQCLRKFADSHLIKLRTEFAALYYEQQNVYLNGLLHRHETKQSSGHKRKGKPCTKFQWKTTGKAPCRKKQVQL